MAKQAPSCPLTTQAKGYPFEVRVGDDAGGVVLSDQVKSLDWRSREAKRKARVSPEVLAEVRAKIRTLIG